MRQKERIIITLWDGKENSFALPTKKQRKDGSSSRALALVSQADSGASAPPLLSSLCEAETDK